MKYQLAMTIPTFCPSTDATIGSSTRLLGGYVYHTEALAHRIAAKRYEDDMLYLGDGEDIFVVEAGSFKRVWRKLEDVSFGPYDQRTYDYDMPF